MEDQRLKESLTSYIRGPGTLLCRISESVSFTAAQSKEYEVGDVIQVNSYYSPSSNSIVGGHFVYVVTHKKEEDGIIQYEGFALSSQVRKSNKNSNFQHNIHIDNDDTIYSTATRSRGTPIMIRVDDKVKFTNKDLPTSGVWKGHVTDEFKEFIDKAYYNYKNNKSNANMYWEVGVEEDE